MAKQIHLLWPVAAATALAVPVLAQGGPSADALPPYAQVTYNGEWWLDVTRPSRVRSRTERRTGTVRYRMMFTNGIVTGTPTHIDGLPPDLEGTVRNGICRLVHKSSGDIIEGPCDRRGLRATITSGPSARNIGRGEMNLTAERVIAMDAQGRVSGPAFSTAETRTASSGPPGMLFGVSHARRSGVPADFVVYEPSASEAAALRSAVDRTIADDSQSWMANRFKAGSVSNHQFFRSPTGTNQVYARAVYRFAEIDGWEKLGWAEVKFLGGRVDCILFHDKGTCTRPRTSVQTQIASLGGGGKKLGAIAIAPACFRLERRMEARTREVVIARERNGAPVTRTDHYSEPVDYTIFQCADASVELSCVAQGVDRITEWAAGTGSTRDHSFALRRGQTTEVNADRIAEYNRRIAAGTCVRTK